MAGMRAEEALALSKSYTEKTVIGMGAIKGDTGAPGRDGADGADGQDGVDGVSPLVEIVPTATGNTINITDKDGTKTFEVVNGIDGQNGLDGADGFAPVVTVTDIEGGHKVVVEDVNGQQEFDVLNGKNGTDGATVIRETLSKILLYAHRGFTQCAPDCSRPAWEDAKRFGFYGLEVDIYSTADNVFICWHDNTIDDLTNGTGKPTELTWDYLQTVEYDSGNGIKNYPHLKIERIESLFSWVKINNMPTLLDVKTIHSYTELTQMVVDWGLEDLIIICTQSEQALNEIRAVSNFVRMRFWEDGINDIYHTIDIASKYYRCDVSNAITEITKEMVEYAHNKGIRIGCYSYNTEIESPFEYYRIANLGVDTATIN